MENQRSLFYALPVDTGIFAAKKRLIDEGKRFVASIGKEYYFPYFCPPCRSEMACWEVSQTLYENGKERKPMNGRKRTVQVKFYVTEEERKLIEEKMMLYHFS